MTTKWLSAWYFGHHSGVCTDCGRVLSDPQETFFGTMCHTCKTTLIAQTTTEKDDR